MMIFYYRHHCRMARVYIPGDIPGAIPHKREIRTGVGILPGEEAGKCRSPEEHR